MRIERGRRDELRRAGWGRLQSLLGTRSIAPKQPLQCDAAHATHLGPAHNEARDVWREFLTLRPLLYGCFSYGLSDLRGELPVRQGDAVPGTEGSEEDGEALCNGAWFGHFSALDGSQSSPRLVTPRSMFRPLLVQDVQHGRPRQVVPRHSPDPAEERRSGFDQRSDPERRSGLERRAASRRTDEGHPLPSRPMRI